MGRLLESIRKRFVDSDDASSLGDRLRADRFAMLLERFPELSDMRVLDLGGTLDFWRRAPLRPSSLVLLNTSQEPNDDPKVESIVGDVCSPPHSVASQRFDLVFSNSVIEHVGGHRQREAMARVVRDAGDRHWVQTPYRYFPIEPHWLFPGFQFLPPTAQARVGERWPFTWAGPVSYEVALAHALDVELLDQTQLRYYFPESVLVKERVAGLTKSLIALR